MVNPTRCKCAVKETDWSDHLLTSTGLKLWSQKINPIKAMHAPVIMKEVCLIIGAAIYYCDMWPLCSHILVLLTDLTGKGPFIWSTIYQQAIDTVKVLMVEDLISKILRS